MSKIPNTQPSLFEPRLIGSTDADWHTQMLATLNVAPGPAWPDRWGSALRTWFTEHGHSPIKTLSLFSGGGGLDIAFNDAGFVVLEMVEIEKQYAATLNANTQKKQSLIGNVKCLDIRDYQPSADLQIDFIIGGPPCQTFSAASRRAAGVKGTSDPRGTLFEEYVRILQQLRPRGFLFENVYGITGAEGGGAWNEIQNAFRSAGYEIFSRILDAADYGTPQHRERLFIVGLRTDGATQAFLFPRPTHGPDSLNGMPYYAASEAIQGADADDETSLLMNGRWGHLIEDIPPGLNYSYYTREMGHPAPVFAWRSKFSDFMYKADPDLPVRTIKAQGGAYTGPFSWENRHFSTAEMKRLQTFPDDYEVTGKRQARIHQIGNSVPPQIGRILALSILEQVFGEALPFKMDYLAPTEELGFRTRKRALTAHYRAKAQAAIATIKAQPAKSTGRTTTPTKCLRYVTESFALTDDPFSEGTPIHLRYQETAEILTIFGEAQLLKKKNEQDDFSYTITIEPTLNNNWHIPLRAATLCGIGYDRQVFTALWKALEERILLEHGIDDLVQLSGYYQYAPKFHSQMKLTSSRLASCEWQILPLIVGGMGVAMQLTALSFSHLWGITESAVLPALHKLRGMGYEVRSNNTNPQIISGEYLIPYAFPTLTPRSVQLRKQL